MDHAGRRAPTTYGARIWASGPNGTCSRCGLPLPLPPETVATAAARVHPAVPTGPTSRLALHQQPGLRRPSRTGPGWTLDDLHEHMKPDWFDARGVLGGRSARRLRPPRLVLDQVDRRPNRARRDLRRSPSTRTPTARAGAGPYRGRAAVDGQPGRLRRHALHHRLQYRAPWRSTNPSGSLSTTSTGRTCYAVARARTRRDNEPEGFSLTGARCRGRRPTHAVGHRRRCRPSRPAGGAPSAGPADG